MCKVVQKICREVGIPVCVSFGLINKEQFCRLREAGVTRVHNNVDSSRRYFPHVCTTHTYDDKIETIKAAQAAGLTVCSGGIIGPWRDKRGQN